MPQVRYRHSTERSEPGGCGTEAARSTSGDSTWSGVHSFVHGPLALAPP
ncbi:MAG TPA: hypothetical protein VK932_03435 [Kofleriaceae bacterium]|nr:hypothetical protein [Kofleriaceae bacterium]